MNYQKFVRHGLTFETRESYLVWRDEWKAHYQKLSTEIRDLKNSVATLWRNNDCKNAWFAQQQCNQHSKTANAMMQLRIESKKEAARQYNLSIQAKAA